MLLLSDDFHKLCRGATVYLDTNIFICAQEQTKLAQLIADLQQIHKAACVTLSSVEYEFTRGSQSLEEVKTRRLFVRNLAKVVMPIGKLLENDKNDAFSAAMSLVVGAKNSQYTDYLLAVALHAYRNTIVRQFVLSADARAFPLTLFDIEGSVTVARKNNEVAHLNLVSLNERKYARILQRLQTNTDIE
jgi:hypothetical protein